MLSYFNFYIVSSTNATINLEFILCFRLICELVVVDSKQKGTLSFEPKKLYFGYSKTQNQISHWQQCGKVLADNGIYCLNVIK